MTGQRRNAPLAREFAASRPCFRRWWQVFGSNQRRLSRRSRRFYSTLLLPESCTADLLLCVTRRNSGPPPSAMRPCVPGLVRGRRRKNPRTGPVGAVTPTVRTASCLRHGISGCLLAVAIFLVTGLGLEPTPPQDNVCAAVHRSTGRGRRQRNASTTRQDSSDSGSPVNCTAGHLLGPDPAAGTGGRVR
jgi:hypothetical protein